MEVSCRICQQVEELMINIFEEDDGSQSDLSNLLERCGGLKVHRNDMFPKYLCKECTTELLEAAKFREKCENALKKMNEIIKIENENKTEIPAASGEELFAIFKPDNLNVGSIDSSDGNELELDALQEFLVLHNKENIGGIAENGNESVLVVDDNGHIEKSEVENYEISGSIIVEEHEVNESNNAECLATVTDSADDIIEIGFDPVDETNSVDISVLEKPKAGHNYACDTCGAVFRHSGNLRKHIEGTHMPIQLYTCSNCEHSFSDDARYTEHCIKCTTVTTANNKDSLCTYCGKRLANSFALNMHLRTHTGERPFPCTSCEKKFKTQSALNTHLKRHAGIAEFSCSICSKAFYESSNLRMHMRSHTGEKPHVCTICSRSFARVFLLQTHMRTHTGERPYECQYCDSKFAQSCDLKNHEYRHTGEKRYKCQYCDKSFNKKYSLAQHMTRHSNPTLADATNGLIDELLEDQNSVQMNEYSPTDYYSSDGFDFTEV